MILVPRRHLLQLAIHVPSRQTRRKHFRDGSGARPDIWTCSQAATKLVRLGSMGLCSNCGRSVIVVSRVSR